MKLLKEKLYVSSINLIKLLTIENNPNIILVICLTLQNSNN